jgi:LysM repeat protein
MVDTSQPRPVTLPILPASDTICPYLLAADGAWRASTPAREHRCTAVQPSSQLATEKQRRLCLTDTHTTCATYRAALGGGELAGAGGHRERVPRSSGRVLTRTAPLVLDHGRISIAMPALRGERGFGQGALVVLMAVAFAAIIVARLSAGGGAGSGPGGQVAGIGAAGASASARPSPKASPVGTPKPSPSPVRTLVPTEVQPSAKPSPKASPKPGATKTQTPQPATYKVKRGDTLSGIASHFGTTVKVLSELNGITDPSKLRIGQVLDLP